MRYVLISQTFDVSCDEGFSDAIVGITDSRLGYSFSLITDESFLKETIEPLQKGLVRRWIHMKFLFERTLQTRQHCLF